MAYNVYFLCDECGEVGANFTNQTVSYSKMERYDRKKGWTVSRHGKWVCPMCQEWEKRIKKSKANKKAP